MLAAAGGPLSCQQPHFDFLLGETVEEGLIRPNALTNFHLQGGKPLGPPGMTIAVQYQHEDVVLGIARDNVGTLGDGVLNALNVRIHQGLDTCRSTGLRKQRLDNGLDDISIIRGVLRDDHDPHAHTGLAVHPSICNSSKRR